MRNTIIRRIYVILITTVLIVSAGVYSIVYVLSRSAMMEDVHERAIGVKEYILENLSAEDFLDIGEYSRAGTMASLSIQEMLGRLRGVGNLWRLYIAKEDEWGEIVTTMQVMGGEDAAYFPAGDLETDLRRSLNEKIAVFGSGIYQTKDGGVYTIFWPVMNQSNELMGAVCMEFDVDTVYRSYNRAALYSLALSGAMIALIFIIAYLSVNKMTEPYFRKLAYTDYLTGCENRTAFEHRLRECGNLAERGELVTIIIMDINNLKVVNDTQGHKVGDIYIKNTMDLVRRNLGGMGTIYRIGGDEFAVIFVGVNEPEAERVLRSLRAEKRAAYRNLPFNIACGAATFTKGVDRTMRDVVGRADKAMYVEKKRQRGTALLGK